jgi:hypothetical protein
MYYYFRKPSRVSAFIKKGGGMKASVPSIVKSLQIMGLIGVVLSIGFLIGTSVIESDIYRAFCLGAFFVCILGIIMLFGFTKIITILGEIRDQGCNEL